VRELIAERALAHFGQEDVYLEYGASRAWCNALALELEASGRASLRTLRTEFSEARKMLDEVHGRPDIAALCKCTISFEAAVEADEEAHRFKREKGTITVPLWYGADWAAETLDGRPPIKGDRRANHWRWKQYVIATEIASGRRSDELIKREFTADPDDDRKIVCSGLSKKGRGKKPLEPFSFPVLDCHPGITRDKVLAAIGHIKALELSPSTVTGATTDEWNALDVFADLRRTYEEHMDGRFKLTRHIATRGIHLALYSAFGREGRSTMYAAKETFNHTSADASMHYIAIAADLADPLVPRAVLEAVGKAPPDPFADEMPLNGGLEGAPGGSNGAPFARGVKRKLSADRDEQA
jgi:hypothetical protein